MLGRHIGFAALATVSIIALAAMDSARAADALPGEGKTVTLGYTVGLLEERFQNQVVALGLEALGYDIAEMVQMDVPALHLAVAQGDVDLIAAHWDPLQTAFYDRAGGAAVITKVGYLVPNSLQGYLIDKKTYDEMGVHDISQLKDPAIAALFDSDGDGKADLAGCPPGWGCERVIEHHLDAYELRPTVVHHQGQFEVMASDTISRFKSGNRVLYYTYTPHWISQVLVPGTQVEWLTVPFTSLPDKDQEALGTTLPDGRNVGFPVNAMRIVANNEFLAENPAAEKLFELMVIPIDAVNAENMELHEGKTSYDDVRHQAEAWVAANQAAFDDWVSQAKAAAQ